MKKCNICENGNLKELIKNEKIDIDGTSFFFKIKYSLCDNCKSEQADSEQLKFNKDQKTNMKI